MTATQCCLRETRLPHQLVHTASFNRAVLTKCTGSNYPTISSGDLGGIEVDIPHDATEQRKIAACLGSLDAWLAAEDRKLAALARHKRGLLQQLFPREGQTRPHLRFPEFRDAGEWETKQFCQLYEFQRTNSYSRDQLTYEGSGVRNIHYGDIHTAFASAFVLSNEHVPFVDPQHLPAMEDPDAFCRPRDIIFAELRKIWRRWRNRSRSSMLLGRRCSPVPTHSARPIDETICLGFGVHLFASADVRSRIKNRRRGRRFYRSQRNGSATLTVASAFSSGTNPHRHLPLHPRRPPRGPGGTHPRPPHPQARPDAAALPCPGAELTRAISRRQRIC